MSVARKIDKTQTPGLQRPVGVDLVPMKTQSTYKLKQDDQG